MSALLTSATNRFRAIRGHMPLGFCLLVGAASPAVAAGFPAAPENESTTSLGMFAITVAPAFRPFVAADVPAGYLYNPTTGVLTSPLLNDSNTTIGVSASIPGGVGGPSTITGVPTGVAAVGPPVLTQTNVINNPTFFPNVPAAFSGAAAGTPEVYTKVQLFDLSNGSGTSVTAGASAPATVPGSYGQVQASTGMGDFPARSFFDIFVDIEVPLPSGSLSLENTTPLLVESTDLMSLPPTVLYIHGGSTTVPIDIVGGPFNGDEFGTINLAAHGVGYNVNNPADVMLFEQQWRALGGALAPEPSTWVMMLVGFAGLGYAAYRRSKGQRAADFAA